MSRLNNNIFLPQHKNLYQFPIISFFSEKLFEQETIALKLYPYFNIYFMNLIIGNTLIQVYSHRNKKIISSTQFCMQISWIGLISRCQYEHHFQRQLLKKRFMYIIHLTANYIYTNFLLLLGASFCNIILNKHSGKNYIRSN